MEITNDSNNNISWENIAESMMWEEMLRINRNLLAEVFGGYFSDKSYRDEISDENAPIHLPF